MRSARKGAFSLECAISNAAGNREIRGGPPLDVRFRPRAPQSRPSPFGQKSPTRDGPALNSTYRQWHSPILLKQPLQHLVPTQSQCSSLSALDEAGSTLKDRAALAALAPE